MSKRKLDTVEKSYISELNQVERKGKFIRMSRRSTTSYTPSSDGVSIIRGTPYNIDITEAEEWRLFLLDKCENRFLKSPFNNAHQIVCQNQVSCTFLGFTAGAHLINKNYVKQITGYNWDMSLQLDENNEPKWMEVWKPMKQEGVKYTGTSEGGMPSIAMMLDVLNKLRPLEFPIEYVPIRGINDNRYNAKIVTADNYEEALNNIEVYLKKMIDDHHVVVLNMDSHTRVFFGYIGNKLLAYDSYTKTQKKLRAIKNGLKIKEKDEMFKTMSLKDVYSDKDIVDVTIGGISLVELRWAASKVKELVYFGDLQKRIRTEFTYKLKF